MIKILAGCKISRFILKFQGLLGNQESQIGNWESQLGNQEIQLGNQESPKEKQEIQF